MTLDFSVAAPERPDTLAPRCEQLAGDLGQLQVLSALLLGLMVGTALVAGAFLVTKVPLAAAESSALRTLAGAAPLLGLALGLASLALPGALWLLGLRSARQAVGGIGNLVRLGRPPAGLPATLRRLTHWLTVWQVMAALSLGLTLLSSLLTMREAPAAASRVVFSVVYQAVWAGLSVFIVQLVKRFLKQLEQRAAGRRVPLGTAARQVSPWLQFTVVVCWLSLGLSLLGALLVLGTSLRTFFAGPAQMRMLSGGLLFLTSTGALLLGAASLWLSLLLVRIFGSSRVLALELAEHFDGAARQGVGAGPGAPLPDPWGA